MKNEHLKRVVVAALSAASVGAVAGVAQEADAQSSAIADAIAKTQQINWGGASIFGGGDWFAEFHQNGYVRELNIGLVNNWSNVFVGLRK